MSRAAKSEYLISVILLVESGVTVIVSLLQESIAWVKDVTDDSKDIFESVAFEVVPISLQANSPPKRAIAI